MATGEENVNALADAERRHAVASLALLSGARETKNAASKAEKKLAEPVKQWLELNEGEDLYDGETEIAAWLQSKKRTTWDMRTMAQRNPELLTYLALSGLITVTTKAFDTLRKAGDSAQLLDAEGYKITGETFDLKVGTREES